MGGDDSDDWFGRFEFLGRKERVSVGGEGETRRRVDPTASREFI